MSEDRPGWASSKMGGTRPTLAAGVWLEALKQDVRYGVRALRKQPLGNAIIVLTMALLIGAASVLYASVREERLQYAPFPEVDTMVQVWRVGEHRSTVLFPPAIFLEYQENIGALERLGAIRSGDRMTLTQVGEPVSCAVAEVTAELLPITGLQPIRGRWFDPEEYAEGNNRVVLISEQLWRQTLEADPDIVGRELLLDGQTYPVVGVLPAVIRDTQLAHNVDVWSPMRVDRDQGGFRLRLFGRLKAGVSRRQAQAELDTLAPRLERQHTPSEAEKRRFSAGFSTARAVPMTEFIEATDKEVRSYLLWAWVFASTIMGCVVGIACFNITNLLLVRYGARSREISIRLSLGAGRIRIVQQLLTETLLLALLGGGLGLLASFWLADLLRFQHVDPKIDTRLYLAAFTGTLLLGLGVGLGPALRASRTDLSEALKEGGLSVGGTRRHRLRNILVTAEVAMASVLCVVGGLMTRSFLEFYRSDLGFEPNQVVSVRVQLRPDRYPGREDQIAYVERGLQVLAEMPGIESAAMFEGFHLQGAGAEESFSLPTQTGDNALTLTAVLSPVSPNFPDLLGMPVVRGRRLSDTGSPGAGEVVVNETFVDRYFPGGEAIGREIQSPTEGRRLTIVGVVRDRHLLMTLKQLEPEVFRDFRDSPRGRGCEFLARTRGDSKAGAPLIREALARLDASQPVSQPVIVADMVDRKVGGVRGAMISLGLLAGIGLLIAVTGVYGVVSYAVIERTREVGIRMALGATRRAVLRMMLWQGMRLMLLGVPLGMFLGDWVVSLLPLMALPGDLSPRDLPTYACVLLVISTVGLSASLIPALRATGIVPMHALRQE